MRSAVAGALAYFACVLVLIGGYDAFSKACFAASQVYSSSRLVASPTRLEDFEWGAIAQSLEDSPQPPLSRSWSTSCSAWTDWNQSGYWDYNANQWVQQPGKKHKQHQPQNPSKSPRRRGNKDKEKKDKKDKDKKSKDDAPLPKEPEWNPALPAPAAPPPATPHPAEAQLRSLVAMLKQNGDTLEQLPAEVQNLVQNVNTRETQSSVKSMHMAVTELGAARKALEQAEQARLRMHSSWRVFLAEAAQRWEGYTQRFAQEDQSMKEQITNAKTALKVAKEKFEEVQVRSGATTIKMEVSDDEDQDRSTPAQKLTEGLQNMAQQFKDLKEQAEAQEADQLDHINKRQKTSTAAPSAADGKLEGTLGGGTTVAPFHRAGRSTSSSSVVKHTSFNCNVELFLCVGDSIADVAKLSILHGALRGWFDKPWHLGVIASGAEQILPLNQAAQGGGQDSGSSDEDERSEPDSHEDPEEDEEEDDPDPDGSVFDPEEHLLEACLYSLENRYYHLWLHPHALHGPFGLLEAALGKPSGDVYAFYPVLAQIPGHPDSDQVGILRHQGDLVPVSARKFTLVDIDIHEHEGGGELPSTVDRKVVILPPKITRLELLFLLRLLDYCRGEAHRCLVAHNNVPWPFQDDSKHVLQHGDYLHVVVPPSLRYAESTPVAIWASEKAILPFALDDVLGRPYKRYRSSSAFSTPASAASGSAGNLPAPDDGPAGEPGESDDEPPDAPTRARHAAEIGLHALFFSQGAVEMAEEGMVLYISSWYLSHRHTRICVVPRTLRLTADIATWFDAIQELWIDHIDPHADLFLWLVHPDPPINPVKYAAGHLLLTQHAIPAEVGVLFSHVPANGDATRIRHFASVIRSVTNRELLLREAYANPSQRCLTDPAVCQCAVGPQLLEPGFLFVAENGHSITTRNHELDEAHSRLPASRPGGIHRIAGIPIPTPDCDRDASSASSCDPPVPRSLGRGAPTLQHLGNLWDSLAVTSTVLNVGKLLVAARVHLIIWQNPRTGRCVGLSEFSSSWGTSLVARTIPQAVTYNVLVDLGAPPGVCDTASCQVYHGVAHITVNEDLLVRDGFGWTVTTMDATIFTASSEWMTLDLTSVFACFHWFDSHFLLPRYDIRYAAAWLPGVGDWLDLPWWNPGEALHSLWVYYDGSFENGHATGAVAAFIQADGHWYFAGALSTTFPRACDSYQAELCAGTLAAKFVHDLLKIAYLPFGPDTEVCYIFDSLTVGKQAAGEWSCLVRPQQGHALRDIFRVVELRYQVTCRSYHVHSHRGDPGNELVDELARKAHDGLVLTDATDFFDMLADPLTRNALSWLWMLFHSEYVSSIGTDGLFRYPAAAREPAASQLVQLAPFGQMESTESQNVQCNLQMTVCSCNVLSLKGASNRQTADVETGLAGPARQEALLQQLSELGVHIFAFQETRLRKLYRAHHPDFFLFKSAATAGGHHGIMVGFTRKLPFASVNTGNRVQDLHFRDGDFAILASDPRFLILRVHHAGFKLLVVAAHAPHHGASIEDLAQWWGTLADAIPARFSGWPRLLLVDANARVGAEPCQQIGSHDASTFDDRAEHFETFVRTQGIFLPSTFNACHTGTSGTWKHSSGSWSRIDFIGLPLQWTYEDCASWVSLDFDPSLGHEDHRAVFSSLTCHLDLAWNRAPRGTVRDRGLPAEPLPASAFCCPVDWSVDVHHHADFLSDAASQLLVRSSGPSRPQHKTTMSDDTWQLVLRKRHERAQLAHAERERSRLLKQAFFDAWRGIACDEGYDGRQLLAAADSLLVDLDRLVFHSGPEFLHNLLHKEFEFTSLSWLHGLRADIVWLSQLDSRIPEHWSTNMTELIDRWQQDGGWWKNCVRRAWRHHLRQESMMLQVRSLHDAIFRLLKGHHAVFEPDPLDHGGPAAQHICEVCSRGFSTPQGLSLHRRKQHQLYSAEHHLVSGSQCPACLTHYWSSQRLQQHLAYMPRDGSCNPCYEWLRSTGYSTEYSAEPMPSRFRGLHRCEALPAAGPLPLRTSSLEQESLDLAHAIERVEEDTVILHRPDDAIDIVSDMVDGEAEALVDQALATLCLDLPLHSARDRLQALQRLYQDVCERMTIPPVPHRPVRWGAGGLGHRLCREQAVPRLLAQQVDWQQFLHTVQWKEFPPERPLPYFRDVDGTPCLLLLHLFSGRRRAGDFHAHVRAWSTRQSFRVFILSLDTAVSVHFGNLALHSCNWQMVHSLYSHGQVCGTLSGPPCETFSEARFNNLAEPQAVQLDGSVLPARHVGPRPLRSADRPFGLDFLTLKELAQLQVGSEFCLQTLLALGFHLAFGGLFTCEHPAAPRDQERPTMWRMAITQCLLQHPNVTLDFFEQFRWGATAVKPTHLLHGNIPRFRRSMWSVADVDAERPTSGAIGRDDTGSFRTSAHKEYPAGFSLGISRAFTDQLSDQIRAGHICEVDRPAPVVLGWIRDVHEVSEQIHDGARWLPDYQPPSRAVSLAGALEERCFHLRRLDLSANALHDDAVASLAEALKSCDGLLRLDLQHNALQEKIQSREQRLHSKHSSK
eukprot:Skav230770  [mRNA]  locus=scaffold1473:53099:63334:- [translate_table: standard]